jgi:hypothetical protein
MIECVENHGRSCIEAVSDRKISTLQVQHLPSCSDQVKHTATSHKLRARALFNLECCKSSSLHCEDGCSCVAAQQDSKSTFSESPGNSSSSGLNRCSNTGNLIQVRAMLGDLTWTCCRLALRSSTATLSQLHHNHALTPNCYSYCFSINLYMNQTVHSACFEKQLFLLPLLLLLALLLLLLCLV